MTTTAPAARIYLNIPFAQKDRAKEQARNAGHRIQFDPDAKKWFYEGAALPACLIEYPVIATPAPKVQKPTAQPKALTDEQQICVNAEPEANETIRWMAYAGSGKTTTLVAYTFARPNKRFLYLAFNKTVAEEGRGRFNRNTDCMTIHALAYRWLPPHQKARVVEDLKPHTIATALARNFEVKEDRTYACAVKDTLASFMATAEIKEPQVENLPLTLTPDIDKEEVLKDTKKIWLRIQEPTETQLGITHDAYLKMYALALPNLNYDYILLDEAQDTNPVTEEIVLNQPIPKILVGDSAQGIYSFRRAENSLEKITKHPSYRGRTFNLTKSFRFGPQIALLANNILHYFKHEKNRLQGLAKDPGKLHSPHLRPWVLSSDLANPVTGADYTLITRSNAMLFQEAYEAVLEIENWEQNIRALGKTPPRLTIGFVGTKEAQKFSPLQSFKFGVLLDVYNLYAERADRIFSNYIKSFPNFDALKDAAKDDVSPDQEIAGPVALVIRYTQKIPGMVNTIINRCGDPNAPLCRVRLTTAHKAKGLEWDRVRLTDDYTPLILLEPKKRFADPKLNEYPRMATLEDVPADEFHLIYMAVTRAQKELQINENLKAFIEFVRRKS